MPESPKLTAEHRLPLFRINISDVRDQHSLRFFLGTNILYNLAGQTSLMDSMTDPFTDLDGLKSPSFSFEVCRQVALILECFASTKQIYGKPEVLPVNEDHHGLSTLMELISWQGNSTTCSIAGLWSPLNCIASYQYLRSSYAY